MSPNAATRIVSKPFGATPDGMAVDVFTLSRPGGATVIVTNQGGCVVSILAPDEAGVIADVTLGHPHLGGYLTGKAYLGAVVGRCANRIASGEFALDGRTVMLARNNGANALHGGPTGFHTRWWTPQVVGGPDGEALELSYISRDGEEGYPGALMAKVAYSLRADGALVTDYTATTDQPTIVNLTNHAYSNLAGEDRGTILGHELQIEADAFTPIDAALLPTGEVRAVEGTPFDFRAPVAIGGSHRFGRRAARARDHNFVLRGRTGELRRAARVSEPGRGRVLEVYTTQPAIQFYSGNFLSGSILGKGGKPYVKRSGFCLEPQHYPDSPHRPQWPSVVLRAGARPTVRPPSTG